MKEKELRLKVKEILDYMAETYCQLGESGKERTRPMKSGIAYTDQILSLVSSYKQEVKKEVIETINQTYPMSFSQDMGSYAVVKRGKQCKTAPALVQMNDEENDVVENIIQVLAKL